MNASGLYQQGRPGRVSTSRFLTSLVQIVWIPARHRVSALVGALLSPARSRRPKRRGSFTALSHAIIGTNKQIVHQVFGPPPAAAMWGNKLHPSKDPGFWQASVWYYPLNPREKVAMAIQFNNDAAIAAELIRPPANPSHR